MGVVVALTVAVLFGLTLILHTVLLPVLLPLAIRDAPFSRIPRGSAVGKRRNGRFGRKTKKGGRRRKPDRCPLRPRRLGVGVDEPGCVYHQRGARRVVCVGLGQRQQRT